MSDLYVKCRTVDCANLVKPWPDQIPFCCHNCWQHFYTTFLRSDLAHQVVGVPAHSDQCDIRQAARVEELDDSSV